MVEFKIKKAFILLILLHLMRRISCEATTSPVGIPLGIILDKKSPIDLQEYAEKAIKYINNDLKKSGLRFVFQVTEIDASNSHELITTICQQMSRGVFALFGPIDIESSNALKTFTDSHRIPYITWSSLPMSNGDSYNTEASSVRNDDIGIEEVDKSNVVNDYNYQIFLKPDIAPTLIHLLKQNRWNKVYYLYNHEEAVSRINAILRYQTQEIDFITNLVIRKINNVKQSMEILRSVDQSSSDGLPPIITAQLPASQLDSTTVMMIDLDVKDSYISFFNQVKNLGMTQGRYHYILVGLNMNELDLNDFQYGGANITGFSLVDNDADESLQLLRDILEKKELTTKKLTLIPNEAALLIDSLMLFRRRINIILSENRLLERTDITIKNSNVYINDNRGYNCTYENKTYHWPLGEPVYRSLIKASDMSNGITGPISLDSKGYRVNYTINVYRIALNLPASKLGTYSSTKGLRLDNEQFYRSRSGMAAKPKKRIIVSIIDPPFMMLRNEGGKNFTGNDRFIGYCPDLAQKISEILNFTYEFRLVKDNKFGVKEETGHWNGIVGELVRNEADMSIAPLTISSQRERAVEFSKPFMNVGISIMIKKPKEEKPGVFSFMAPLSAKVWVCIVWAHIGVTLILFLVSRFSPYEWHLKKNSENQRMENDFTLFNTLWFCLAAFMQQGVDISPKSGSGRLAASVWWFFTLILISSYTANLAAFLTIERMVAPIESVEDLAKQTEIKYGAVDSGSTKQFFELSNVPLYRQMWEFMKANGPSVFVKDNHEGVQKVRDSQGKYAFLLESSINEYLNERHPCNTMKVGSNLDSKGYGIATPFGSDLKETINLAVLQLRENGFLEELRKKWWIDGSECGTGEAKDTSQQSPLNLINVAGVFYILIIGLILSVLIAACEVMYKARVESKKNQVEFSAAIKSKMRLSISGYDDSMINKAKQMSSSETEQTLVNDTSPSSILPDSISPTDEYHTLLNDEPNKHLHYRIGLLRQNENRNVSAFENQTQV